MKVLLNTYGGLVGGLGNQTTVVNVDDLSEAERQELSRLVAAATAMNDTAQRSLGPAPRPDAQVYEITIEDEQGRPLVLEATDGSVPSEFADLRNFLRAHRGA